MQATFFELKRPFNTAGKTITADAGTPYGAIKANQIIQVRVGIVTILHLELRLQTEDYTHPHLVQLDIQTLY